MDEVQLGRDLERIQASIANLEMRFVGHSHSYIDVDEFGEFRSRVEPLLAAAAAAAQEAAAAAAAAAVEAENADDADAAEAIADDAEAVVDAAVEAAEDVEDVEEPGADEAPVRVHPLGRTL